MTRLAEEVTAGGFVVVATDEPQQCAAKPGRLRHTHED